MRSLKRWIGAAVAFVGVGFAASMLLRDDQTPEFEVSKESTAAALSFPHQENPWMTPFPFPDGKRVELPAAAGAGADGGLLQDARSVFAELSADAIARWGRGYENTTIFSGGMKFSDEGRVVENKMLNAVLLQGGFVAAFTGISITAGHDCLFEQSYPVLLNGTMSRLMAAIGVRFEAINVAMGNTRTSPYSYCVDAHAGIDADIISWEMSMEVPDRQCGVSTSAIELFIRSASVLPRRPAVLVMDAMPDAGEDMCGNNQHLQLIMHRNRGFMGSCGDGPEENNLMSLYREFGLHQMSPSDIVPTHACGDPLFSRNRLFGAGKHFPHPMSWHPAPAAHALVADMLFMHYAKVLLNALDRLEKAAPGLTAPQLRDMPTSDVKSLGVALGLWGGGPTARPSTEGGQKAAEDGSKALYMGGGRGTVLPRASWCSGWRFCEFAGNYRCANTYFPLAGIEGSSLTKMVSKRTPVINAKGQWFRMKPKKGMWALTLNEEKAPIFDYLKTTPPEGMNLPIDRKWVLVGNNDSGPIDFDFETIGVPPEDSVQEAATQVGVNGSATRTNTVADDSRVVVCRPDFIDRVSLGDPDGVAYAVDGVPTNVVRFLAHYGLHQESCVLLAAEVGVGRHTLTVQPLRRKGPLVAISHVIYPA